MFGVCAVIILVVILICATVILWKFIDDHDIRDLLERRSNIRTVEKMVREKAEIGDRFSDEEIRIMYELLSK